jgi:hypothetical protein
MTKTTSPAGRRTFFSQIVLHDMGVGKRCSSDESSDEAMVPDHHY